MINLKYSEILQQNNKLAESMSIDGYNISVLSNIILNQFNPILEFSLRKDGVSARCSSGDYDNIMQDSQRFSKSDAAIIFWELANLIDGLQYKANSFDRTETEDVISRFKSEIDFVFQQMSATPLVVINMFSTLVFNYHHIKNNNFDTICEELNKHLVSAAPANVVLVEIDKVIAGLSVSRSVDFRNYYSSKSLYTIDFLKAYVSFISPVFLSVNGKGKKALIFDCDNTLWSGIIGEDGRSGIEMSAKTSKGVVFEEIQFLALELSSKGVIIGLNSKNNLEDVDEVLELHPDMKLRNDTIVIKKINWEEKAGNLQSIAQQLNIGIDSLVFVDDSDFEINLVNEFTPQVKSIQVPKERYQYPEQIRRNMKLFYSVNNTLEDASRVQMYKEALQRDEAKASFNNLDEYLRSLNLKLTVYMDDKKLIQRVAQLTQKTNQFNLTTKRYTESEIQQFIDSDSSIVFAIGLSDKYGDFGITGAAIIRVENSIAFFDSFLLSCRILGRKVEIKFIQEILTFLKKKGIAKVTSRFAKTLKNAQVLNFYDDLGFKIESEDANTKNYSLSLGQYKFNPINFINTDYAQ